MKEGSIFLTEEKVIGEAEELLDSGALGDSPAAGHYRKLLISYKKLFRQTQRMVRMGDMMQNDLNELNEKLARATRSKSEFLANMSHEIRTPMNAVMGLTELALKTDLTAKQRGYMEKTLTASRSLIGIINDILDFSKIEAGKLDLEDAGFRLDEVMGGLSDLLSNKAAEKGIELITAIADDVPRALVGDSLRLGQVLINLTGNAVKFTQRGEVEVKASLVAKSSERAKIRIAVRDTGIGIHPELIPGLFNAFTQADGSTTRRFGGTGLGLAISRRLVEMMGGEIRADSEPGVGSTFYFTVELKRQVSEEKNPKDRISSSMADLSELEVLERIRNAGVLLIEDNALNREVAAGILDSVGVRVKQAVSGKEAIELIERSVSQGRSSFDAVLMDVQMPEMDGFQATRIIRSDPRFIDLPIIAMTAHAMKGDRERCIDAGMSDYVPKPIDPVQLFSTLAGWIEHKEREGGIEAPSRRSSDAGADPDLPRSLPGIDMESALKRLRGNGKLLRKIIDDLHRDHGGAAREVKKAIERGDLETAERLAHTVKGIAGNLSAMELHAIAGELEMAIRMGKAEDPAGLLERFQEALNKISESVKILEQAPKEARGGQRDAGETQNEEGGKSAENTRPDLSMVTPLFLELNRFLEEGNLMAEECFDSLRRHLEGCGFQTEMEQLGNFISGFDLDSGREILARIARSFNIDLG